jgi:eukaryotic-like serine/threonine-protein kinase
MYKSILVILFFIISVNTLVAQTKTLSKSAYSIKYPDDWRLEESSNTSFTLGAPSDGDDDAFVENINFVSYPVTGYLPKDYAQYSKTTLPQKIKNFKVVEEKEVKQGDKTGYYMIFKGKQGNQALKWKQYYFIKNGMAYVLTFSAQENMFSEYSKKISACLNSFTVK